MWYVPRERMARAYWRPDFSHARRYCSGSLVTSPRTQSISGVCFSVRYSRIIDSALALSPLAATQSTVSSRMLRSVKTVAAMLAKPMLE